MSLSNIPQYQYTALDQGLHIRLLRVKSGHGSDDIRVDIFDDNLGQHPIYEALSYTWGPPNPRCLISCGEDGTLSVTRNCETALRRLRHGTEDRTLWIDAICIDQTNALERGQQVQLMSQIYHQAHRVLAYFGEASDGSDVGMDFIQRDSEPLTPKGRPSVGLGPDVKSSPQQLAIDAILDRPYFKRIWILQEIVFAKTILIILGNRTVDWEDFSRTVFYVDINKKMYLGDKYDKSPPSVVFYRDKSRSLASGKTVSDMPKSLLEFLRDTRHCQSTDARDKSYALLGMSMEKDEPALVPNYFFTIQQTFTHLAKFLISRDKTLDVLCHVQGPPYVQKLPSWVPDWSCHPRTEIIGHKKDSVKPYKASLGRPANVVFHQASEVLNLEGKVYDTVSRVGPIYNTGSDSSATTLKQWENMISMSESKLALDAAAVLRDHERSEAAIFQGQVTKASNGRALFLTDKGYVGLGPAEVEKGDRIAVLLGGSVPFVLRQRQSHFTLVGESYVRGLMHGEAIQGETVAFQTIQIE
ncbi:Heterokaryon incompatibility protein [Hyphodiscus hymeniophilus]|uniref:Heterokaryon incompatibility protein n=1 Tax=Hyphodiscus hymeniophilus TaxID=353542 RepID=A0A9P6VHD5_9HELO|nr:Heterokaryon incompatibility protein [Hyphodiscus hymeniophilus]